MRYPASKTGDSFGGRGSIPPPSANGDIMTIDELIELAKQPMTDDEYARFLERQEEQRIIDKEWADSQRVTNEWLNREYNI